jgi:hypothetical protein
MAFLFEPQGLCAQPDTIGSCTLRYMVETCCVRGPARLLRPVHRVVRGGEG